MKWKENERIITLIEAKMKWTIFFDQYQQNYASWRKLYTWWVNKHNEVIVQNFVYGFDLTGLDANLKLVMAKKKYRK